MRQLLLLLTFFATVPFLNAAEKAFLASPDRSLTVELSIKEGRLGYALNRGETALLHWAPLGLTIDNVDCGANIKSFNLRTGAIKTTQFPVTGVKNQASVSFVDYTISGLRGGQDIAFRVFNNGVAFCYTFKLKNNAKVSGESSAFGIPAGAEIWTQDSGSALWSVEGTFRSNKMSDFTVPSEEELKAWGGDWNKNPYRSFLRSAPVTVRLANGTYIMLQEAGNFNLNWCGIKYAFKGDKVEALYFIIAMVLKSQKMTPIRRGALLLSRRI